MADARYYIPEQETLARPDLEALQRRKLAALLGKVMAGNAFYRRKLAGLSFDPLNDPLEQLPFTTRAELEMDQAEHPPYGSNLTYGPEMYRRMHQTSGSSGRPLRWLDSADNWDWWKQCWGQIYAAARITPEDRLAFPFSFGPYVGFWGAFEASAGLGHFVLAAGGMSTTARLRYILDNHATVVCCTPTYALRMAETAQEEKLDLAGSPVRALIVAGEPGGSIPATRKKIEQAWGARCFDHTGMTEIGPLGFECLENPMGVHVMENQCIAEIIDPVTRLPSETGAGELVITNLGRTGSPVIRYRTGDQVVGRLGHCACGRSFVRLEGGIVGRVDDMFVVRGNNVFPSALENLLRQFTEIAEYAVELQQHGALTQLLIKIETSGWESPDVLLEHLGRSLMHALNFRPEIKIVPPGSLPRFEMKAKRFSKVSL
jgi:phenylacetate-CoA ligase